MSNPSRKGSSHELFIVARRVATESSLQAAWDNARSVEVTTTSGFRRARTYFFTLNRFGVTHYGSIIIPAVPSFNPIAGRWRHVKTDHDLLAHASEQSLIAQFMRELKTFVALHTQ